VTGPHPDAARDWLFAGLAIVVLLVSAGFLARLVLDPRQRKRGP
jgi:hypothetical protein